MHNTAQGATAPLTFNFHDSHDIRVQLINGEPWFVLNDVTEALAFTRGRDAARMLDDDEKGAHIVRTLGGNQELTIVNESGLYSLILRSRKPEAKRFKKWVTSEVLPAIRKTGQYQHRPLPSENMGNRAEYLVGMFSKSAQEWVSFKRPDVRKVLTDALYARYKCPSVTSIPAENADEVLRFLSTSSKRCANAAALCDRLLRHVVGEISPYHWERVSYPNDEIGRAFESALDAMSDVTDGKVFWPFGRVA